MVCVLFLVAACFCAGALGTAYQYAIATFPGEPFSKFQLEWKQEKGTCTVPLFFGYTWNGGKWPTYVIASTTEQLSGCLTGRRNKSQVLNFRTPILSTNIGVLNLSKSKEANRP
jgi:hypothetical protein